MSIEQALADLAAAIREQTKVSKELLTGKSPTASVSDKLDKLEETLTPKKSQASTPKATPEPKGGSASPSADATNPAYTKVKTAILGAIAAGHRTPITALLKKHGAKTGQDLDASVYDEVLGDIDAIVNGDIA